MAINSLSASSYGLSGLVSGMNSQDMVEKLLSGTQSKIDKAGQRKTTLQNKQTMYRDVATKLRTLQSSFLSFSSKTNLLSNSFYNTMTAAINPPKGLSAAFSVIASSSASAGSVTMNRIEQLATARQATSTFNASATVSGVFSQDAAKTLQEKFGGIAGAHPDNKMTIKVGDQTLVINDAVGTFEGMTPSQVADEINRLNALQATAVPGSELKATARFINNKLEIIADDPKAFITVHGNQSTTSENPSLGMKMFGNVVTLGGQGTFSATIDTDLYQPGFIVDLDGRQETLRVNVKLLRAYATSGSDADRDAMVNDLASQVTSKFGNSVTMTATSDGFELKTKSSSQNVKLTGAYEVMGTFGLKSGVSSKISQNMAIKDLNFAKPLQGSQQKFTINGVEFSFSSSTSLASIISEVNNSKAGVKISYVDSLDRFKIEAKESGAGMNAIVIENQEGNLMTSLFGVEGGKTSLGGGVSQVLTTGDVFANGVAQAIHEGGSFMFNVNGKDYTFTLARKNKDDNYFSPARFAEEMNDAFKTTFGTMANGDQAIEFQYDPFVDTFSIVSNSRDHELKIVDETDPTKNKSSLGFTPGDSTIIKSGSGTLGQAGISIGGTSVIKITDGGNPATVLASLTQAELNALGGGNWEDATFDDIAAELTTKLGIAGASVEYDAKSGAFRVISNGSRLTLTFDQGDGRNLDNLLGGMKSLTAGEPADPTPMTQVDGQNAVFYLNGLRTERTSNSFTIDGLTYTLHNTTLVDPLDKSYTDPSSPNYVDPADPLYYEKTGKFFEGDSQINITRDTDKIVEGLQEYLKLYNETIDYLNELYKADATYKDYPPLTSAQKNEMSDREVELWEEKSQEGLLRGDQHLGKALESLRKAMYTKPEGSTLAIYDLGINTSYYTNDGNFTEQTADALKAAIEKDPEGVRLLFAGEGGIMEAVNNAINDATRSSYATPGYLVREAGSNISDTNSTLYKQIKQIDEQLTSLETRYWNEYNRYWKQFNAMEQLIQQMNSQSSWLSQQFAG